MNKTLVVNFFGGPGTGKSTMTADIFAELKWKGINTEMALEYAKRKVWEGSCHVLKNQLYVLGKQYHTQKDLDGQVDIIVTDSPLINSIVYNACYEDDFDKVVMSRVEEFNNLNIFLNRVKPYNPIGRMQSEDEAKEIDVKVKKILDERNQSYVTFDGCKESVEAIANYILIQHEKLIKGTI